MAYALRLEPSAISKILSGTRQIKAHEYNLMRQYFGLTIDGERASNLPEGAYCLEPFDSGGQTLKEPDGNLSEDSWVIPAEILS
ncbi:MAG: hypothetical protein AB8B83_06830, partial [Bdellovibrionales bacterium]